MAFGLVMIFLSSALMAQNVVNSGFGGDLLMGFRIEGGSPDRNYVINLGSATNFVSRTTSVTFGIPGVVQSDYGDDLTKLFGVDWFSNNNLLWGLWGQPLNISGDGNDIYAAVVTDSLTQPGDPILRKIDVEQGTFIAAFNNLRTYFETTPTAANVSGNVLASQTAALDGTWTTTIADLSDTKEARISSSANILSLYRAPLKALDDVFNELQGDHLGYFSIDSNGVITFTPKSSSDGPGDYTGPWVWTAGSGNWSEAGNWTNSQPPSDGSVVGITGAEGTITNDSVTSLASLTFSNTAGSYVLTGSDTAQIQTLSISGGITNNSAAQQTIDLSIAGTGGITQSGSGTMVLSRSNSYIGGTTLSSGAVVIGNSNALGTGTVTVSGASSLIAGTSNLSTTNAMVFNASTTIDTAANRWTNAGTLSGAGSLTKIGSGTLTIAGTGSTFSGNTLITNGAIQIASGSSLGSGTVTVASGTKLSGSGTVGGVDLRSGGILTGGVDGAVGKLTVSGGLTFSAGSILNWKLAIGNASNPERDIEKSRTVEMLEILIRFKAKGNEVDTTQEICNLTPPVRNG